MKNSGHPGKYGEVRESVRNTVGYRRIISLFDEGSFQEIDALEMSGDGPAEAVAGYGTVNGCPACAFSQNRSVSGGAMSKAQASKIRKTYQLALKVGCPIVGIYDSIGGRLKEGADMLAAFGEILHDANRLSGVVPQLSLVFGPCTGTGAMLAASADIVIMSGEGELTVSTAGEGGSPEEAVKTGVCHAAVKDEKEALETARRLLAMLPSNNIASAPICDSVPALKKTEASFSAREAAESVCDGGEFLELGAAFGTDAFTALAHICGGAAGLVTLTGTIDADSCSKAARFVRFCDSFSLPVATFVDAEKFGTLRGAGMLSSAYSEATTAKITAVTGSACGPVYIATVGRGANADYAFAWPNAVVSALAPETAVVFLENDRLKGSSDPVADRKKLFEEYRSTSASAATAAADGMIEDIVEPEQTREKLAFCMEMLSTKRVSTLPKKHADIQL